MFHYTTSKQGYSLNIDFVNLSRRKFLACFTWLEICSAGPVTTTSSDVKPLWETTGGQQKDDSQ